MSNEIRTRGVSAGTAFLSVFCTTIFNRSWMRRDAGALAMLLAIALGLAGCGGQFVLTGSNSVVFQVTPSPVAFGAVTVGQSSAKTITLHNETLYAVKISQIAISGDVFTIVGTNSLPVTVDSGGTYTIATKFAPTAVGSASGNLTVTSNATSGTDTVVELTGTGATAVPPVSGLSCTSNSLTGAETDSCTVTLSAAASGDTNVSLSSDNASLSVPSSVTVPDGANSASFAATAQAVSSTQTATLAATAGGSTQTYSVVLYGTVTTQSTLSALSCNSGALTGAKDDICTVTMTGAAASDTTVSLSSDNAALTVPSSVTVAAGDDLASFTAKAQAVSSTQTVRLTATAGGITRRYRIVLNASTTTQSTLSALSCNSGSLTGTKNDICTVTMSAAATSDTTVSLSSDNAALTVPSSVTVAVGDNLASFTAKAQAVSSTQTARLTATAGGVTKRYRIVLNGATTTQSKLSALSCSKGSLTGAATDVCTVTLEATATADVKVGLSSDNTSLTVPSSVTVASGAVSASFKATAAAVDSTQTATLTASAGGVTKTYSLLLNDSTSKQSALSALSCSKGSLTGATRDYCTVTLTAAATSDMTVNLSSNNASLTVPSSVTIASGAVSASFRATAAAVSSTQNATLTATAGGVTKTFSLVLNGTTPTTLSSLSCSKNSLTGAATDLCTVALTTAASASESVSLASDSASVTVPSSVTVAAGASSASFTASAQAVTSAQTVTLTATAGGVTKTYSVLLNGATALLKVNATSIAFGNVLVNSSSTQTVTLTSAGTNSVTVTSAALTGVGFTLSGSSFPATLTPGQTATVNVTFSPETTGAATGSLTITSTSATAASTTLPLSGTGESVVVQLNWDAPSSTSVTIAGYNIYRATGSSSSYSLLNSGSVSALTFTDASISAGTTYSYYVTSVDASGNESVPSNTATAVIP